MLRNVETIDWSFIGDELRRKREAQPVIDWIDWIGFFEELRKRQADAHFYSMSSDNENRRTVPRTGKRKRMVRTP